MPDARIAQEPQAPLCGITPPTGADGASEFDLPVRVRSIVERIESELYQPVRQGLSDLKTTHTERNKTAQRQITDAEAIYSAHGASSQHQLAAAANDADSAFEQTIFSLSAAHAQLHSLVDSVRCHLTAQGVSLAHVVPSQDAGTEGEAQHLAAALLKSSRLRVIPVGAGLGAGFQWVFTIATSIGAALYLPLLGLWWPLFVVVWRFNWDRQVAKQFARLLGIAAALSEPHNVALHDARTTREEAIAKATLAATVRANIAEERLAEQTRTAIAEMKLAETMHTASVQSLISDCSLVSQRLHDLTHELWDDCSFAATSWRDPSWTSWEPDPSPEFAASIGTLVIDDVALAAALHGAVFRFRLPALVPFLDGRCLLLNATGSSLTLAVSALQSVTIRALANTPPGKARFTFIDPVALGHNVSDFMTLGDFDEALINGRAWTETRHIDEQLSELTAHMETVIQKYLRNDFSTIHEYNRTAQEVAEAFRFLVIFDFPVNFSEASARRLTSIVRNGPRCGVFTFIVRDTAHTMPHGFTIDALVQHATVIDWDDTASPQWKDTLFANLLLQCDALDDCTEVVKRVIARSGEAATSAMKVEVPFDRMLSRASLTSDSWWKESAATSLRVPLGPSGARKLQYLALGEGLTHHALLVGRTGSGKTNLLHVIITALALTYSPAEMAVYLVDFKGGVGFKPYATHRLPHARVVAIESEREFGMSVLTGLDTELKRRFELFRASGVDNLTDYRKRAQGDALPRILLIVDEFQEFFSQDDAIAQQARMLFDRLVRQGRSFGLHILLGTQSLAGHATLPASTMGQMAVRIVLPCSDSDARAVLSDGNSAARSLSRAGEGIYNSAAGAVEGNNPFQAALFSDIELERYLQSISAHARTERCESNVVVFEGSEPASLGKCLPLDVRLQAVDWETPQNRAHAWLGEPVALLPPVEALFTRQSARHLLIVERDEATGLGIMVAAWVSLLAQHRPTAARFLVYDLVSADGVGAGYCDQLRGMFPHDIEMLNRRTLVASLAELTALATERLDARGSVAPPVYVLVLGLHRARDLRPSDDYYSGKEGEASASQLFTTLLRDGPEAGIHVLAWCDSVASARRTLDRSLKEFAMRAAGAMSPDDSRVLLDATDAGHLQKPYRLVFADEDRPGARQMFRPYALPDFSWLANVATRQRERSKNGA